MKIGERGQVTIPKAFRDRFGLSGSSEVEFVVERGELILRKKADDKRRQRRMNIEACKGILNGDPADVDQFIEDIRGR